MVIFTAMDVNNEELHGIYKLTHLFGGISSAEMTQGFAVKLNTVKMQMFTCRFEKHNKQIEVKSLSSCVYYSCHHTLGAISMERSVRSSTSHRASTLLNLLLVQY